MTHVLAVRLDNDGDVLLAGPAIRALAAGADRVTLLCGPRGRQAAHLLPGVDEVLVWRAPWIDPDGHPVDRDDIDALVARIAALRIDRALIFGSFHQSPLPMALLLRLAGVPWIGATSVDYPGSNIRVPGTFTFSRSSAAGVKPAARTRSRERSTSCTSSSIRCRTSSSEPG